MKLKGGHLKSSLSDDNKEIISWGAKYATGIISIDKQHKELVDLTNKLYYACLNKNEDLDKTFKTAMHSLVEYVCYHFREEQTLLEQIKFPAFKEHKKEHEKLIKDILEISKNYGTGNKFVPNQCVRTLKEWVFGHIAVSDKIFASYVKDQKKKGFLTDL